MHSFHYDDHSDDHQMIFSARWHLFLKFTEFLNFQRKTFIIVITFGKKKFEDFQIRSLCIGGLDAENT